MPGTDPATITGAQYLVDVDTVAGSTGDAVSTYGVSYSVPSGAGAPTLKTGAVNGHKSLVFTGGFKALIATPPNESPNPNNSGGAYPSGFSAIVVVKGTTFNNLASGHPNDRRTFVGLRSTVETSGDNAWSIAQSGKIFANFQHHASSGHWGSDGAQGVGVFATNQWYVVGIRTNGQTLTCWKGLSLDRTDTNAYFGAGYTQFVNGLCLGGDFARPTSRYWSGEIAYFVAYPRAITDNEYSQAATWLLDRFGLPEREIAINARIGTTGQDLFLTLTSSLTGKPAHITASDVPMGITYKVDGGSAINPSAVYYRAYGDNDERSNLIAIPLTSPVTGGQAVTLSIAVGGVKTILGPCEEATDLAVINHAGSASMLSQDLPAGPRTMSIGWNVNHQGGYYVAASLWRNLFKTGALIGESSYTLNANGYPITPNLGTSYLIRTGSEDATSGDGLHGDYPGAEYGRYLVQWDGPAGSLLELASYAYDQGQTVITHVPELDSLGGTTKKRYFDVTPSESMTRHRPTFTLRYASDGHTCTNIYVGLARYEGQPGIVDDNVVARLSGAATIRAMDLIPSTFTNIGNVAELTPLTDATWTRVKTRTVAITRIEAYSGQHYSPDANIQHWKVTFGSAHGLTDGQGFTILSTNGDPVNVTLASGVRDLRFIGGLGNKLSDTEFYFAEWVGGGSSHSATVTPFTGGNAVGSIEVTGGAPIEAVVALANECDVSALQLCVPHPASDALVEHMADVVAANLDAGRRIHFELSNEPWNLGFSQWSHFRNESVKRGLVAWPNQSTAEGYIAQAIDAYETFKARWLLAGRSADDIDFVVNSWNVDVSFTTRMATWLAANRPAQHCRWSFAPYFYPMALGRIPGVAYSEWTLARMLDYHEAWATSFDPTEYLSLHVAELETANIDHTLCTYENQFAYLGISDYDPTEGLTQAQKWSAWNREALAIYFSPRTRGITFQRLKQAEDAGVVENTTYGSFNNIAYEFANFGYSIYGDFPGLVIRPGLGDGTDGETDNRPHVAAGNGKPKWVPHLNLTSVRGGASLDWHAAYLAGGGSPLTASWGAVTTPRTEPVTSVSLTFSESVTGVSIDDVSLRRDGDEVSLSGAELSGSGTTYTLNGLSSVTDDAGVYILRYVAAGSSVATAEEEPLSADAVQSWTRASDGPSPPLAFFGRFGAIRRAHLS